MDKILAWLTRVICINIYQSFWSSFL